MSSESIGRVVKQEGPDRFSFRKQGNPLSQALLPGDYVEIGATPESSILAIVGGFSGEIAHDSPRSSRYYEYSYTCQLVGDQPPMSLVGAFVFPASSDSLRRSFSKSLEKGLGIGELATRGDEHIPLNLDGSRLLGTHTCLFGASGYGKSTLLGLILEEIVLNLPEAKIVILDPNSDFVRFESCEREKVNHPSNRCAAILDPQLVAMQTRLASTVTEYVEKPTLKLSRFEPFELLERIGGMNLSPNVERMLRLLEDHSRLERVPTLTLDLLFRMLSQVMSRNASELLSAAFSAIPNHDERNAAGVALNSFLQRLKASSLWATSADDSLDVLKAAPRLLEFNLGHLPSFSDRAVFAEVALRQLWTRNEETKEQTFVVIDEAHHVAPAVVEYPWQKVTVEWINRIAGEGRKYGLFLILVSQRPAKLHSNTLDNCSNYFVMRLQNQDDLASLSRGTVAVPPDLLSRVSAFQPHESLIFGRVSPPAIIRTGRRRMATQE